MSWTDPRVWLVILVSTLVIFVVWELLLLGRHVRKVDDLANALHEDLVTAEAEIAELKATQVRLNRLPGQRLPTVTAPKLISDTQSYGRHAHKG